MPRFIAVDHASSMLAFHQQRTDNSPALQLLQADMIAMPLPDNSVDLVFANLSLHWSVELIDVLAECHRILAKEGLLLFSTLGPKTFFELRESFTKADDHCHIHPFLDMHQIGDALMKTRFYQPVVDRETLVMTHATVMGILNDLQGLGVQNSHSDRPRGLMGKTRWQKMLAAYEEYKTADGRYPVHYEVIYGQAWAQETKEMANRVETRFDADSIPFRRKD